MRKICIGFLFPVFLSMFPGDLLSQPAFKGYMENRLFTTVIGNDFSPGNLKNNLRFGNYNRTRVELNADVSENSFLNLTVDYFNYSGYLLQPLRAQGSGANPTEAEESQKINIDRAYFKLYFDRADVTIGKQRVSWGQSMLWSPFDVFNRVSFFEPQEEKAGVTAVRITVPTGITGSVEGVFSPETTVDESRTGLRILWNRFGSEFTVNAIHNVVNTYAQNITGASIKTDLVVGLWAEGAYFSEKPLPGNTGINYDYFRFNAGMDYSFDFGKRLFVSMEYMHDESGESDKSKYDYINALTKGRSLLGSDYIYGMAQLTLSEFTSLSAGIMANVNDGGVLLMPGLSHSLFPNTELSLGVYVAAAKEGTEFNPSSVMDPLNYAGNTVLYCWFKLFM